MNHYSIDIRWSPDDGAWVAVCPELGDLSAVGDGPDEAARELGTAIDLAITTYKEEGWSLPEPSVRRAFSGQFRLRLPKSLHTWLAREAEREGVSLNTFVLSRLAEVRGARDAVSCASASAQHGAG